MLMLLQNLTHKYESSEINSNKNNVGLMKHH